MKNDLLFLNARAEDVAPQLLGFILSRQIGDEISNYRIVEVEAYDSDDPASHSFKGEKIANSETFRKFGRLYVYFTYGMHYCCNVVVGPEGQGAAVLIRAIQPLVKKDGDVKLYNGPAKLSKNLQIDKRLNGHNLLEPPLILMPGKLKRHEKIVKSKRIGISKAKDKLLRFYIEDNPYVS